MATEVVFEREAADLKPVSVGLLAGVDIVLAVAQHPVHELSKPSCNVKDGNVGTFVTSEATVGSAEGGLCALERASRHAQSASDAVSSDSIAPLLQGLAS